MRFRITKNNNASTYFIIVSGEIDDDAGWDLLQIAQAILSMPHCSELIVDLRAASICEDLSVFTNDTLVSAFEESLLKKNSTLVVRYRNNYEIRLCSDQQLLEPSAAFTDVSLNQAKFFGNAMKWLEPETRLLTN